MLSNNISDIKFLLQATENAATSSSKTKQYDLSSVVMQTRTDIFTQHAASNAGKVANKMLSMFSVFQCIAPL
jgi:hypothetical protein